MRRSVVITKATTPVAVDDESVGLTGVAGALSAGSVAVSGAAWNLPATISVQQDGTVGLRQYALNAGAHTISVSGLPTGVTYNAGLEQLEGASTGTASATVTFTLTLGAITVVATATVALIEQASGFVSASGEFAVSGSLVDGGTITITDSSSRFGVTGPSLVCFDTCEQGTVGAVASSPTYGSNYASGTEARYSDARVHSGTKAIRSRPGVDGDNFVPLDITLNASFGEKYYFSAWLYIEGNDSGQIKIMQLWGDPFNPATFGPGWLFNNNLAQYMTETTYSQAVWNTHAVLNQWQQIEFWGQFETAANTANSSMTLRRNGGSPTFSVSGVALTSPGSTRRLGEIHWLDGHTNPTAGHVQYHSDEIYVQKGWARVLIGNNATYSQCTQLIPQRVTSWSAGSIGVSPLFASNLPSLSNAHLFVVDNNNAPIYVGRFE